MTEGYHKITPGVLVIQEPEPAIETGKDSIVGMLKRREGGKA